MMDRMSELFLGKDDDSVREAIHDLEIERHIGNWLDDYSSRVGKNNHVLLGTTIEFVPTDNPEHKYTWGDGKGPEGIKYIWKVGGEEVHAPFHRYLRDWLAQRALDAGLIL